MIPSGAALFFNGDGTSRGRHLGTINVVDTAGLVGSNAWANNSAATPLYSQTPQCGTGIELDPSPCNILGVDRNIAHPMSVLGHLVFSARLRATCRLKSLTLGTTAPNSCKTGLTDLNQPALGSGWTSAAQAACIASASDSTPYDNCSVDSNAERQAQPYTMSCSAAPVAAAGGVSVGLGKGSKPCFPYLGFIDFFSNINKSNCNGLQASLTQRTSHGAVPSLPVIPIPMPSL